MILQHWGLSARSPSAHPIGPLAQPAFIDEDDSAPLAERVFLSPWPAHSLPVPNRLLVALQRPSSGSLAAPVKGERLPFALYASTTLSMVVAISEIGVQIGRIMTDVAAALVGAAMLTVLLFPATVALRSRAVSLRSFSDMKTSYRVS
jgi:hypothetical protein